MDFEWDPVKAKSNLAKHGVDFADAAVALEDDLALTILDPASDEEDRYVSLCRDPQGRVVVVAFTWRGDRIRIVSARKATRREMRQYEEGA